MSQKYPLPTTYTTIWNSVHKIVNCKLSEFPLSRTTVVFGFIALMALSLTVLPRLTTAQVQVPSSKSKAANSPVVNANVKSMQSKFGIQLESTSNIPGLGACSSGLSTPYPIPIDNPAVVTNGDTLFSFGGFFGPPMVNSYKFDGATWTPIAPLPVAMFNLSAFSDGTVVYLAGEEQYTVGKSKTTVLRYDTLTNTYVTLGMSPGGNRQQTKAYLNGKIYLFGGFQPDAYTWINSSNLLEIYDIASNSWAFGASSPLRLSYASAFVQGNFIYSAGGIEIPGWWPSLKTFRYDTINDTWDDEAIADLPATRYNATSSQTGYGPDNVWILNAGSVSAASGLGISWNPVTNAWNSVPAMSSGGFTQGAIFRNRIHTIGRPNSSGGGNGSTVHATLICVSGATMIEAGLPEISTEGCGMMNGLPDPGENVSVRLGLRNIGDIPTSNLIVTLQPTGGVTNPSPAQIYGSLPSLGTLDYRSFSFTVDPALACGAPVDLTFAVTDGATQYPSVTRQFISGQRTVTYEELFLEAIVPSFPSGWTTVQLIGTDLNWLTRTSGQGSTPFASAHVPRTVNLSSLISPPIVIQSTDSQLRFDQRINTYTGGDGMVLEYSTDAGANWTDVIAGGGTFVSGGYVGTLKLGDQNPIEGRYAWSGYSGTTTSTVVNLPAALFGQTVQFRWLVGTTNEFDAFGFDILNVQILGPKVCNRCGPIIPQKPAADFDGDGKSDSSVFRPGNSVWYIMGSSSSAIQIQQFGLSNDKLVPGDYDGDSKADIAVFRDGDWYISQSSNGTMRAKHFGEAGDIPTPADYDGDGLTDFSVYRPSIGVWYYERSSDATFVGIAFGTSSDLPVPGDYNGDGKAEIVVWRPSNGTWIMSINSTSIFGTYHYGANGDRPVQADYDGDGKTDFAVFRPSNGYWFVKGSTGAELLVPFGTATDVAIPGDYDGDRKADMAYFRPSNGVWSVLPSSGGASSSLFWGQDGDKPVPAAYLPEQ